jgi:hypothetical protein
MQNRRVANFKRLVLLIACCLLPVVGWMNFSGHGWLAQPNFFIFDIPGYGDVATYYDRRMTPIRQAILPFEPIGCCIGQSDVQHAVPGMQRNFVGYVLAPAIIGKAGEFPLVLIDLDNDRQVMELLPKINGDLVVNSKLGAALVRLREPAASPEAQRP